MSPAPRWVGLDAIVEDPESPQWDDASDQVSCTRTFNGPYSVVFAARPLRGQVMDGYPDMMVDRVTVRKAKGGRGTMTVLLVKEVAAVTDSILPQPQFEIEWEVVEKPLIQNPVFASEGKYKLTDEDIVQLGNWENETDSTVKKALKYRDKQEDSADNAKDLSDNAKAYASKRLKGSESYRISVPVVRRTTLVRTPCLNGECDEVYMVSALGSLLGIAIPSGYQYLKTADRCTRSGKHGKWQRQEEWTGAKEWDEDLYSWAGGEP